MNAKAVSLIDRLRAGVLLFGAVALPLGVYLKTYDAAMIKDITLIVIAALLAALWIARVLESGRIELPFGRGWLASFGAVWTAWIVLSFSWNPHPTVSVFNAIRQVAPLIIFLTALLSASRGLAAKLADWTVAAAAAAALYAVCQKAGLDQASWQSPFGARAFSTLASPTFLGAFLAASIPLAWARLADRSLNPFRRAASAAAAVLLLIGLWTSASPVGGFSLIMAAAVLCAMALMFSRDWFARASALGIAGIVSLIVVVSIWQTPTDLIVNRIQEAHPSWSGAVAMFRSNPLLGSGTGSFDSVFPEFRAGTRARPAPYERSMLYPSEALRVAAEQGIVGLGLAACLLILLSILAVRNAFKTIAQDDPLPAGLTASCAAMIFAGLLSPALSSAAIGFLLAVLSACLAAMATEVALVGALGIPAPPRARDVAAKLILGSTIAGSVAFAFWAAKSDINLNLGIFHARNGRMPEALAKLDQVGSHYEYGSMARYVAANLVADPDTGGDAEAALARYQALEKINPAFGQLSLRKGALEARLGRWEDSEKSLARAARLQPWVARTWQELVEVEWNLDKPEEARKAALQLVMIQPNDSRNWRQLAETYRRLDRTWAARKMERKAKSVDVLARRRALQPIY